MFKALKASCFAIKIGIILQARSAFLVACLAYAYYSCKLAYFVANHAEIVAFKYRFVHHKLAGSRHQMSEYMQVKSDKLKKTRPVKTFINFFRFHGVLFYVLNFPKSLAQF